MVSFKNLFYATSRGLSVIVTLQTSRRFVSSSSHHPAANTESKFTLTQLLDSSASIMYIFWRGATRFLATMEIKNPLEIN